MTIRLLAVCLVTICAFLRPTATQAATLEELIYQSKKTGDWGAVKQQVQIRADAGDPASLTALAQMQLYGLGGQQDFTQTIVNLRKAAEQNFGPAQNTLGFCYGVGVGVTKDSKVAAEWYQKAASQGNSEAQYNLGYMHASGELGGVDEKISMRLYEQAGEKGFAKAWLNLGAAYLQGNKVLTKNLTKAEELLKKAADAGETAAQFNLGLLYVRGDFGNPNPALAYYYLTLANSQDSRGICVPPALWIAARLEGFQPLSQELTIRQELARQSCMIPFPQAKPLLGLLDQAAEKYPEVKTQMQAARTAALQFLDRRKLMDAPANEQVSAAKATKYEGEYAFFKSLPEWRIVKMLERSGDTVRSEMRPPNETGENWTKTLQYEQIFKLKHSKPFQHIEPFLSDIRKQCTDVIENKTFDGDERGFPTYVGSVLCAGKANSQINTEMHFFKAVQGIDSFYFWHIIWRGDKEGMLNNGEALKKTMVEFTALLRDQIVCDLRVKQGVKACPTGLPGV